MVTIKDNTYFYIVSIEGSKLIDIDSLDSVTISAEAIKGEPQCDDTYEIKDNLFIKSANGEWKCNSIYYQNNDNRKDWQFWKPKKICSQAIMGRIKQ